MSSNNGKVAANYDKGAVKQAARGRWADVLTNLAGIPGDVLDGRHHPCPACNGTDRFRALDDFDETGAVICNKCFSEKNGDGIAAVEHYSGRDFQTALKDVAGYLGVQPSQNGNGRAKGKKSKVKKDPSAQVKWESERTDYGTLITGWCKGKPPIIEKAAEIFGARFCWWPNRTANNFRCVAFTGRDTAGNTKAVLLYRILNEHFPEFGNLQKRKTHLAGGSVESWLYAGEPDTLQTAEMIVKCEGLPDALALLSVGLPDGWIAITNACGARSANPKKLDFDFAAGKKVAVVSDADTPGQDGGKRFAVSFADAGAADVRFVTLPYEVSDEHGKDLRDWLNDGHGTDDFAKMVNETEAVTTEQVEEWRTTTKMATDKPSIVVSVNESKVVDEAIAALAEQPNIYQRGGVLVHVVHDQPPPPGISRPKDSPRIASIRLPRLQELMASAAYWWKPSGEDEIEPSHPPGWAVKAVDARGEWLGIRRLDAVVESPVLRADGTVLQTPGYDPETGLIFAPQVDFPEVPSNPTWTAAARARDALLVVIADFPFGTAAHRAAWLSGVLTPLSRFAFHGPAPLHLMDANVRGCGKSLLADVTGVITAGRAMARMTQPRDEDEFRKRITSLAMAGESHILIDNVAGALGGASLDAALTATTWSDRILGRSEMASNLPLFATWYATGNNVVLLADTARRTLHVRLESPEESPEERTGFQHPDLLAWVRQERPRLTVAAMTMLRAYCVAGRPSMELTPWGSFEGWSDLVRQSIVWCGLPDPGETRQELAGQADVEAVALVQLIDGWAKIDPEGDGMTVVSVLDAIADFQKNFTVTMPADYQQVRDAINELVPAKAGRFPTARSTGMKFNHLRRRVIGGRYLDKKIDKNGNLWYVTEAKSQGTMGTMGTNSALPRGHAHAHTHTREEAPDSPASPASPQNPDLTPEEDADVEEFLRS